jgi:hypothetical protein
MKKTLLTMTAIAGLGFGIALECEEIITPEVYGTMNRLNQLTLSAAPDRDVKAATVNLLADQQATVAIANLRGEKVGSFTGAMDKLNQLELAAAPDSEIKKAKANLLNGERAERYLAALEAQAELKRLTISDFSSPKPAPTPITTPTPFYTHSGTFVQSFDDYTHPLTHPAYTPAPRATFVKNPWPQSENLIHENDGLDGRSIN